MIHNLSCTAKIPAFLHCHNLYIRSMSLGNDKNTESLGPFYEIA